MTTPYELVKRQFPLPFPLYPFQIAALNEVSEMKRSALWLDMGTGKTIVSIASMLYRFQQGHVERCVVIMPPILLKNWSRTLSEIPGTTHTIYRGTPVQRMALPLDSMFTLMSYQIFCRDVERLREEFADVRTALCLDESTHAKNVATITFRRVREWVGTNGEIILLSGSPLSTPHDGYAPIKLKTPDVYKNLMSYENIHVKERDIFKNVTAWKNLDLLNENLMLNAVRVLKTDVLADLPPVTHTPVYYELDPLHAATYKQLCDERLLPFANGDKIDATAPSALFHALQQIQMNREVFTGEEGKVSVGVELIEEMLHALGKKKLVVFTAYRATNRMLTAKLKKYNVVAVYGEISRTKQDEAVDRFVEDPSCRVILLQYKSAGYGIDRLQRVCSDVLFAEMPLVPAHYHQAVARLWRVGQFAPVTVRVAIAEKTLQVRLWDVLQEKDTLVNLCVRGYQDLREALAGR